MRGGKGLEQGTEGDMAGVLTSDLWPGRMEGDINQEGRGQLKVDKVICQFLMDVIFERSLRVSEVS